MGKTDISRPGTISIISIFSVIIVCILTPVWLFCGYFNSTERNIPFYH